MVKINSLNGFEDVLDTYFINKDGSVYSSSLKNTLSVGDNGHGYKIVSLKIKGIRKWKKAYIHRLVALAYVEGYEKNLEVNHKDENKNNNNFSNLEWVTRKYNNNYGSKNDRCSSSKGSKCYVYDYKLEFKGKFNSINKASEILNTNFRKNNSRTEKYFIVDNIKNIPNIKSRYTTIALKDLNGKIVEIFATNREARRFFNETINITDAIKNNWIIKNKYKVEVLNYQILIDSLNLRE